MSETKRNDRKRIDAMLDHADEFEMRAMLIFAEKILNLDAEGGHEDAVEDHHPA